ncbi:MAG: FxsA family protein [Pikeienuella sp.]
MRIILALIAVPVIEIALFIELGGLIGTWPTVGMIILTAIIGGILLRQQGFSALQRMQNAMAQGGDPRGPMAHGAMILIAGLLMLTPGFFTDTIGFLLLTPPVRAAVIAWAGPRLAARVVSAHQQQQAGGPFQQADAGRNADGPIDAEYVDLTDGPRRPGGSGWSKNPEN